MNITKVKLSDICIGKGNYGIPASAVPFSEDLYTYLRITDINDDGTLNLADKKSVNDPKAKNYILKENDIVFARTGNSTGRSYFYDSRDGELVYAGFLIKFSLDHQKVNPLFIKYYAISEAYRGWIASFNTGSTRGNINAQTYANMEIPLPPRSQQDLTVDILSSLDSKIRWNTQINHNLEEQAKAILDQNCLAHKTLKVGDIVSFANGFAFKSSTYIEKGKFKVVTIKNVQDGKIDTSSADCVHEIPAKMKAECILNIGDVLLSLTGNVGRTGIVCENNLLLNQRVAKIIPHQSVLNAVCYFIFRRPEMKAALETIARGTAQANLSPVETLDIEIPFDIPTLQDIALCMKSFFEQIISNEMEIQTLAQLRDTLLPKLMSGEIDVSEVEV